MNDAALAYLAGIVDGEGCMHARVSGRGRLVLRLSVSNTSPELMEWIVANFGGQYGVRRRHRADLPDVLGWEVGTGIAVPLLKQLLPHLIVKARQAELFLELAAVAHATRTSGRNGLAHGRREQRDGLVIQLRDAKRAA